MRFGLLGPLEVISDDGTFISIPQARQRELAVVLLLSGGRPVPPARLVDMVWGRRPASQGNTRRAADADLGPAEAARLCGPAVQIACGLPDQALAR